MARTIKASIFCQQLAKHLGEDYVYGMPYGLANRKYGLSVARTLEERYGTGKSCGAGYYCVIEPKLNGNGTMAVDGSGNPIMVKNYYKGKSSKSLGKPAMDCSGLLAIARWELTGVFSRTSAEGEYNRCATRTVGPRSTFPAKPGVFVFHHNGTKFSHVGVYIGGGFVIESANVNVGVIKTAWSNHWTHWGYWPFLEYDVQADTAIEVPPVEDNTPENDEAGKPDDSAFDKNHAPYLKRGDKGAMVRFLQEQLAARGWTLPLSRRSDGTYDGDFGAETDRVVRRFQKFWRDMRHYPNMVVDGEVGPITWSALLGYICKS